MGAGEDASLDGGSVYGRDGDIGPAVGTSEGAGDLTGVGLKWKQKKLFIR